jgi:ubiquitin carboxyl-terminal hydrolase 14
MVTDELKEKMVPVNTRFKEIEKERNERRKVRRKIKQSKKDAEGDVTMGEASSSAAPGAEATAPEATGTEKVLQPGELEDEKVIRTREAAELHALVHPELKSDEGANVTGCYELVGKSRALAEAPIWA